MPSNVEIKFRVADLSEVERRVKLVADSGPTLLVQNDTYFEADIGRLKLRVFSEDHAELIAYHRIDDPAVRESQWLAYPTGKPKLLMEALQATLRTRVTVCKERTLYLVGQTRIHLDRVRDLGEFVELEVVLTEGQGVESGALIANQLVQVLGLGDAERMSVSYADLLLEKS